MLNTLPPSIKIPPPRAAAICPPIPRRKRGGQLANRNALHHGLFAIKNRTPFTAVLPSITTFRRIPDKTPQALIKLILELQEKVNLGFHLTKQTDDFRSQVACYKIMVRMLMLITRLRSTWVSQHQPLRDLLIISKYAHALIRLDFRRHGITRDADSFREKNDKSDFNSPFFRENPCLSLVVPHCSFITPRQWRVLEPLLPPSEHSGSHGRPPVDPRLLLDAIFWKFAHHARWQDLPDYYPPMLSCRRYYRRLFLSGRLATLYSALYKDFCARGKAGLMAHVLKGCFNLTANKITLRSDQDETWQARTALLFIQQAMQVLLCIRRDKALDHRRKFPTLRRLLKDRSMQYSPLITNPEPSYIPLDLSDLDPHCCK